MAALITIARLPGKISAHRILPSCMPVLVVVTQYVGIWRVSPTAQIVRIYACL